MADPTARGHALAAAMEKAGPSCTASEEAFQEVLKPLPAPTEQAVADVLAMIVRTSKDGSTPWNVEIVVEALKAANPALDWVHVAGHLDEPTFTIPDVAALSALMAAWKQAATEAFPLRALIGGLWTNAEGQLSFLRAATTAPPEFFDWAHAELQQAPLEGLHGGKSPTGTPNRCWMALDLYNTLAKLVEVGQTAAVRSILETPLKACPEILLLGAASVKTGWGPLQSELVDALVATYIAPHPNSLVVLQRLWPLNPDCVLRAMAALYAKDPTTVARSLDVCNDLKVLTEVLQTASAPFCMDLAALAARREFLNLEKWLGDQCSTRGATFMQAAVSFLDAKLREDVPTTVAVAAATAAAATTPTSPTSLAPSRLNISVETLAVFLRALASNAGLLPTDTLQQLKLIQAVAVQNHPELATIIAEASGMEAFPPDVEEEANNTFSRMYRGEISVDALVEALKGFKDSTNAREQEVFACMVHNLFDEFRFFFKYPPQELHITAVLFGQLVEHSLVSSVSLGIALRYVLDALHTDPSHKLFKFGTTAAHQFQKSLVKYPSFAAQLVAVPKLKESDPELYTAAEAGVAATAKAASTAKAEAAKAAEAAAKNAGAAGAGAASAGIAAGTATLASATTTAAATISPSPMNAAGFPTSMPAAPANPNMLFSTINAETLEQEAQTANYQLPDQKSIDRVHFLVNNLTMANVEVKSKELAALVPPSLHPWFVNYLVVKRASQEPNFHPVYVNLVERWGDKPLRQSFVRWTVHYCKVMLGSKLLKTNSSERTLLKNLGAWLGKLTLAANRPVLQKDLDVKAIIIEAYEGGRMLPVLSFVRNLLEPCSDSKAFRPPNPWVMAILSLLAEIYQMEGLKTSLKFEVELLFKQLDMQLADVVPSTLLAGRQRETVDNMDFQVTKAPAAGTPGARPGESAAMGGAAEGKPPGAVSAAAAGPVVDPNLLASLPNFIVISPQLSIIGERLGLKRVVQHAIERAVLEIISPVVDRSVTIACMTAHELVIKDFAVEPDPESMRRAAHLCVAGLAQSLALVTAREPLRLAATSNLRGMLAQQLDSQMLDNVVAILVNDNLDLCCQIVERAAGDRAQKELDERLAGAFTVRARAKAAGQPFQDASQLQGRFPAALPDLLRAHPAALTPQQQRIYQDFATIPRTAAAAAQQTSSSAAVPPGGPRPGEAGTAAGGGATTAPQPATEDPQALLRSRFISWIQRMDAMSQALGARDRTATLASLPEGHEAKAIVAEVATLPQTEQQAIDVAKNVFTKLYQGASAGAGRMHCSAYASALAVLRDAAIRRLPMEATAWFSQLPDDMRGQREATEALVRVSMLSLPDFDAVVAKSLATPRFQPAVELVFFLLQSCVAGPNPCLSVTDLPLSIDFFTKLAGRFSGGPQALQLVEEARRLSAARAAAAAGAPGTGPAAAAAAAAAAATSKLPPLPQDPPGFTEAVMKAFDEWARLLEEQPGERTHLAFVQELRDAGLLGSEEATERFVRVMASLAVAHCLRSEAAAPAGGPRSALSFVAVDAFVRLMVCLITQHGGGPPLFSRILGLLAVALHRDADERAAAFNGRPYYRMMVGFLAELSPAEQSDEAGAAHLLAIAGFLFAVRPLRVPAFAFPWLQLVADRRFMPRLLMIPGQRGWPAYLQLLLAQLLFLEPFLRSSELTDTIRLLYKGTLRLLLVLLHDFPEFLCQYHFRLCDAIPLSCIQMRNLVLSAFPRAMRLPDPFTQDLKVDQLPEVAQPPRYSPPVESLLPPQLRAEVDGILGRLAPPGAALSLRQRLVLSPSEALAAGSRYNVPLINALVFYVGIRAVEESRAPGGGGGGGGGDAKTASLEILATLIRDFDSEGRYLLVNALANHLRYPNSHSHWFSCTVLSLFTEAGEERIQEQITRVLLERLIVNRPHPWGLLITFIELIKNPRFNFWSHSFTRMAPEIERLFESVARSCMGAGAGAGGGGGAAVQAAA